MRWCCGDRRKWHSIEEEDDLVYPETEREKRGGLSNQGPCIGHGVGARLTESRLPLVISAAAHQSTRRRHHHRLCLSVCGWMCLMRFSHTTPYH